MVNGYNATNINNVEMMSAFLSDPSTFSSVLGRIKKSEIKLATIPIPLTKEEKAMQKFLMVLLEQQKMLHQLPLPHM